MKPPPFDYSRPESVDEAVRTLAQLGDEGKVLAGGQSLVPLLSMRLAAPHHLVDINRLHELAYVRVAGDTVRVGALARHAQVLADEAAFAAQPLLRQALGLVAHATIRNRGTTVGSIVHADPAGEMTAVLALLGGTVRVLGGDGERAVPAVEFFLGPLESAVGAGELAVEAAFPALPARSGTAFVEVARRHGDYAVCGVAATVTLGADGVAISARAAYLSVAPTPLVLDLTEAVRAGEVAAAVRDQVAPEADIHASADYRRHLAAVLTERALSEATDRAAMSARAKSETPPAVTLREHDAMSARAKSPPAARAQRACGRAEGACAATDPPERQRAVETELRPPADESVRLVVNATPRDVRVPARRLLSDCLRHDLRLTGTHVGCEHGVCGACTVLVDGVPMRSCLLLAVSVDGAEITTVEGLTNADGTLSSVQQAFNDCHGLQCGFCTPGFLTTIEAGLRADPEPSEDDARAMIGGNLCRCTGYQNIVKSVLRAAEIRRES